MIEEIGHTMINFFKSPRPCRKQLISSVGNSATASRGPRVKKKISSVICFSDEIYPQNKFYTFFVKVLQNLCKAVFYNLFTYVNVNKM